MESVLNEHRPAIGGSNFLPALASPSQSISGYETPVTRPLNSVQQSFDNLPEIAKSDQHHKTLAEETIEIEKIVEFTRALIGGSRRNNSLALSANPSMKSLKSQFSKRSHVSLKGNQDGLMSEIRLK